MGLISGFLSWVRVGNKSELSWSKVVLKSPSRGAVVSVRVVSEVKELPTVKEPLLSCWSSASRSVTSSSGFLGSFCRISRKLVTGVVMSLIFGIGRVSSAMSGRAGSFVNPSSCVCMLVNLSVSCAGLRSSICGMAQINMLS